MTSQGLPAGRAVVIDPGHGGEDHGGAGAAGYLEAELTVTVARRLSRLLEGSDLHVVLTRNGDCTVAATERRRVVREWRPALCVSIHTAGYPWSSDVGIAAWYSVERFLASRRLARVLVGSLSRTTGRPSRGALFCLPWGSGHEGYQILVGTGVPTVVVELGCHTSGEDERLLRSESFRNLCAAGLCAGILRYLNLPDYKGEMIEPSVNAELFRSWSDPPYPRYDPDEWDLMDSEDGTDDRPLNESKEVVMMEEAATVDGQPLITPPGDASPGPASGPDSGGALTSDEPPEGVDESPEPEPLTGAADPVAIEAVVASVTTPATTGVADEDVPPLPTETVVTAEAPPAPSERSPAWPAGLVQPFFRQASAGTVAHGPGWYGRSHVRRESAAGHFGSPRHILKRPGGNPAT